jgi:hypothetical protein
MVLRRQTSRITFRPVTPSNDALLIELVRIDLERRLAAGERLRLEEAYLRRFSELSADPPALRLLPSAAMTPATPGADKPCQAQLRFIVP